MSRVMFTMRGFHSTARAAFKQKVKDQTKQRTPKKGSGEYRSFRRTAAYSEFSKKAQEVSPGEHLRIVAPTETFEDLSKNVPEMVCFPDTVQASLTHLADFQPQQNNELFRQRATLLRAETAEMASKLGSAASQPSEATRLFIDGPAGAGKSSLLAQAHALAKLQGWVVLHIPRAEELTDGNTDVTAAANKAEGAPFLQPMAARRWLTQIAKANKGVLTSDDLKIIKSQTAREDPARALNNFFAAAEAGKVAGGSPVLLSIDSINAWAQTPMAVNRDRENQLIYHKDLQIPRIMLDFLSGARNFPKGAVIAARSSKFQGDKTVAVAQKREAVPAYAELSEFDPVLAETLSTLTTVPVQSLQQPEAKKYLEYLHAAGILPELNEDVAAIKYAQSGNGNPRALLRSCVAFSL